MCHQLSLVTGYDCSLSLMSLKLSRQEERKEGNSSPSLPLPLPPFIFSPSFQIARWPGFKFPLDLSGMDEFNHLTAATARFYFTPPPEVGVVQSNKLIVRITACFMPVCSAVQLHSEL